MTTCKCDYCGITFQTYPSKVRRAKNHFCSTSCHDKFRLVTTKRQCKVCGKEWTAIGASNPSYRRKTCSEECHKIASAFGLEFGRIPKRGTRKTSQGYIEVLAPNHPRANANGYVKRSILVIEAKIGRPLRPSEIVHHIDGNKENDYPDNLRLFASNAEHVKYHYRQGDYGLKGVLEKH